MSRCKEIVDCAPCRLPKKEWDWLLKNEYLTKKQMKFLKKAEAVGFEVEVKPRGHHCLTLEKISWSESEVVLTKRFVIK